MPEPEAMKGFQVGISRFLDFSSLVDTTTPMDQACRRTSGIPHIAKSGIVQRALHWSVMTSTSCTCVIFGAGEYYAQQPFIPRDSFVVAADGGLDHARELGMDVDFVVGDFDSITGARPSGDDRTIVLPPEKDDPDLLSALKIGWAHGARTFHIYGALGGRIDHTISNIQLMALLAERGASGYLHGDGEIVTAICDGEISFQRNDVKPGRMVSVFSHSDSSTGVNEIGLKYEIHDARMSSIRVNGLSNEFSDGNPASISVRHGTLIVTFPMEAPLPRVTRFHTFDGDLGRLDTSVSSALVR